MALQPPFQNLQRSFAIPRLGDEHLEYLALVISSPPERVSLAIDPDKHPVQVPTPVRQ
jgi:hypothetical protein